MNITSIEVPQATGPLSTWARVSDNTTYNMVKAMFGGEVGFNVTRSNNLFLSSRPNFSLARQIDSYFQGLNNNNTNAAEPVVAEPPPASQPETVEEEVEVAEAGSGFASGIAGLVGGAAISHMASTQDQSNLNTARQGLGPLGHSMQAENFAETQNNYNDKVANLEELEIGVGSMFGPEGLLVGAGAAAVTGIASSFMNPSPNSIPTNMGTTVSPDTQT